MYRPGELTERVQFQRNVREVDAGGGYIDHWQDLRTEYALVRPLSGSERLASERTEATSGYLVVIRARRDILESDRIAWGDCHLNIRFIRRRKARDLYTEIDCALGPPT